MAYYAKKHKEQKQQEFKEKGRQLRNRKYDNVKYRLWENTVSRINKAFVTKNVNRTLSYKILIGCNEDEFFEYILTLLNETFTLNNYSTWELDHTIPICRFDLSDLKQQLKCFNYKNIGILSLSDNRQKNR